VTNPLDINQLRARVQQTLTDFISEHRGIMADISSDTLPLVDSLEQLVSGGKRLRPAFAYWGYLAGGGRDSEAILKACTALEFLQACALIHDDVMDNSDTRRGAPAVHKQFEALHLAGNWFSDGPRFGAGAAILIGDLALSWADELIFTSGLAAHELVRANEVYHVMRTELMAGQYLDLLEQVRGEITVERSARVIRYKSAKYTIERPLLMGAAIADAPSKTTAALSTYGLALGEAFQLRDDLLGVFGDAQTTGKPSGDDLREGKQTMLIAKARELASPSQVALVNSALGDQDLSAEKVIQVQEALIDCGAQSAIENRISEQLEQALEALADLADEVRTALTQLAVMATKRAS
jgi:geranylgeranyl diphosphate synthase type I